MKKTLFFVFVITSFSLHAKEGDLEKIFNKASSYYRAGEPKKAISLYKEAYELAASGIKKEVIAYNLAASYLEEGQLDQAIDKLENLFEKKERLPEYLIEKCSYNLLLSYIRKSEEIIEKNVSKSELTRAHHFLKKGYDLYHYFSESVGQSEDEEIKNDLWLTLKKLTSKYHEKLLHVEYEDITFEEKIENLKERVQNQVYRFEKLAEKEISLSMAQYFLSKDYVKEKKSIPLWESATKEIEKKIEERENQDSQEAGYLIEELQSFLKSISESYNEYLSSLDCMKENRLWPGRLCSAKSKMFLELIDLYIKKRDGIEHCLSQRIHLQKKQNKSLINSPFHQSLSKEIKLYSNAAYSFIDEKLKNIESLEKSFDKSLMTSLGDVLKSNLKIGSNYKYDFFLYEEIKKDPGNILYPVYVSLLHPEKINEEFQEKYLFQLKAAQKRFDLQKKLDYEEEKKNKIMLAHNQISSAYHHYCEKDYGSCRNELENFLLHWQFKLFMLEKVKEFKTRYNAYKEKKEIEQKFNELASDLNSLKELTKRQELSEDEVSSYLLEGFDEILSSINLSKKLEEKKLKDLLLENGNQWALRMARHLNSSEKRVVDILQEGIKEQEHALEFSKALQKKEAVLNEEEKMTEIAKKSQQYPIDAVDSFELAFSKEFANKEGEGKEMAGYKLFNKGLEEAHSLNKLLSQKEVSWDEVSQKQKVVVKHWKDAIELVNRKKDQPTESHSSQQKEGQSQEQKSADISQSKEGETQKEESIQTSEDEKKIMGILERLQEMQQDDKIGKQQVKNTKKGLRPW